MKTITSSDNPVFKQLKSLTTSKGRNQHRLCILEGEKIIFENLSHVEQVFLRETTALTPNLADLDPVVLSPRLFDEITNLETPPGILATATVPTPADVVTFPALVLDRIQDPGNVGTLLRTAAAFGFNTVILIDSADAFSQKVVRSAMGLQFRLNIRQMSLTDFLTLAQTADAELIIADMGGSSNLDPLDRDLFLVLGNEGGGVSHPIKQQATKTFSIPMQPHVESLNVAVSGGILMHILNKGEDF